MKKMFVFGLFLFVLLLYISSFGSMIVFDLGDWSLPVIFIGITSGLFIGTFLRAVFSGYIKFD